MKIFKKAALTCLILVPFIAQSQVVVDTVPIYDNYANQTFFSFKNGIVKTCVSDSWDIGITLISGNYSIITNEGTGTKLWKYPNGDNTKFGTQCDTAGIKAWAELHNSSTDYFNGAFNRVKNATNPLDYGWGNYSLVNHKIEPDHFYIIKLANGQYKQVIIDGTGYDFRFANLNGSDMYNAHVDLTTYSNTTGAMELYAHYSIRDKKALAQYEPYPQDWDLVFTNWGWEAKQASDPAFIASPGVIANPGRYKYNGKAVRCVRVNKVTGVPVATAANPATYTDTTYTVIRHDWKYFNSNTNSYKAKDSITYFVALPGGDVYKMAFIGFQGPAKGNYIFNVYNNSATAVPVKLYSFTAKPNERSVEIKWSTASEENNAWFEVQRSTDGIHFTTIKKVAGAGNSDIIHHYTYHDENISSTQYYYRIKSVDYSGKTAYESPLSVRVASKEENIQVYPNPVAEGQSQFVSFTSIDDNEEAVLTVFTASGINIFSRIIQPGKDGSGFDLSTLQLTKGIYFVALNGAATHTIKKVVIF